MKQQAEPTFTEIPTAELESASDNWEIPGTSHLVDHDAHDETILIPTPSDDPEDPLNWSKQRKWLHLFCLLVFIYGGAIPLCCVYSIFLDIAKDEATNVTLAQLNEGTGYCFLFLGIGNFVFMPLAQQYGKRPVYLISLLGSVMFTLWQPYVKSRSHWIASKILSGFFCAPVETLLEVSVTDLFFEHERGRYIGAYGLSIATSNFLAPAFSGLVADAIGWRWSIWIACIYGAVCFVFIFFFLEETNYDRSMDQGSWSEKKSFVQKLRITGGVKKENRLLQYFIAPFCLAQFPVVLWCGFLYGVTLFWYSVLNGTEATILGTEPYNFSSSMCGLAYLSPVIFTAILYPVTGWLSDMAKIQLAKRRSGRSEAEDRLWILAPYCIVGPCALILWGVGAAHHIHWFGCLVGLGLMAGTTMFGIVGSLTYVLDTYKEMNFAAMTVVIMVRNGMNFGMDYAITPFVTNLGYQNCFIVSAFICLGCTATFLVMVWWGKAMRVASKSRYQKIVQTLG